MHLVCPRCSHVMEFFGVCPPACAACGHALAEDLLGNTQAHVPETPTLPPAEPAPGEGNRAEEVVGGYRLLRVLGGGGMGTVYEAIDPASGRRVALKLILPEYAASPEAVQRFRQEGRLASKISHPRCVFVLAADEEAGRPYIVMELMPGTTLKDLVKREGPLPVERAVALILDALAGLQAAHQLGVLHRDIKPSNCFLDRDGRVKVGDFGLAKSLLEGADLTRKGTFLGTPLFASPEQIKRERLGPPSDLYSLAATLYFLLTGQAPFQTNDPLAVMVRVVADDPKPMRTVRPDLPAALDRVVLRGLARDPARRWAGLAEFRAALLPFAVGGSGFATLGLRLAACVVDGLLLAVLAFALGGLASLSLAAADAALGSRLQTSLGGLADCLSWPAAWLLYFAVQEGVWGCTLGKWVTGLRVTTATTGAAPGVRRVLLRAALLLGLLYGGWLTYDLLRLIQPPPAGQRTPFSFLPWAWLAGGTVLALCTMRPRNGYRGLHEFLSGTGVIRLGPRGRTAAPTTAAALEPGRLSTMPQRLGAFTVRGVLPGTAGKVLVGEDDKLGRSVWLWLRADDAAPLAVARQELGRPSRLRWVAWGREGAAPWDAFLAPPGNALGEVIGRKGKRAWPRARVVLEQLAEELAAACGDGTLPERLSPEQVWIQSDGSVLLLDMPPAATLAQPARGDWEKALTLLRAVTVLILEGRPRSPAGPVRAPLPLHAARVLDCLFAAGAAEEALAQFRAGLAATRSLPRDVSRDRRACQLFVGGAMVLLGGSAVLLPALTLGYSYLLYALAGALALPLLSALVWRGGLSYRLLGMAVVRRDGRPASRLRCAVRALLVWAPVTALLLFGCWLGPRMEDQRHAMLQSAFDVFRSRSAAEKHTASQKLKEEEDRYQTLTRVFRASAAGLVLLVLANSTLALVFPRRSVYDLPLGTYLVPR